MTPSFGVSFDATDPPAGGGGGGSATAAPPAAAAPAAPATPAAPTAPAAPSAPTAGGDAPKSAGFFRGLKTSNFRTPTPSTAATPAVPSAGAAATPPVPTKDTAAAPLAPPAAKPGETTPPVATPPPVAGAVADALPKPILGRYTTVSQVEEAMRRSADEGMRLATDFKKLKEESARALETRDTRLASLEAELKLARETPAFRELTQEEVAAMKKDDPVGYTDYVLAKRDRDAALKATKEQAERDVRDRNENAARNNAEIDRIYHRMRGDTKEYPMFQELEPSMNEILDVTGGDKSPLIGKPWAPELCHLAALGKVYLGLISQGKTVQDDAAEKARLAAEAAATQARGAAGGGGGSGAAQPADEKDPKKKETAAWRERVRGTQPKNFLDNIGKKTT